MPAEGGEIGGVRRRHSTTVPKDYLRNPDAVLSLLAISLVTSTEEMMITTPTTPSTNDLVIAVRAISEELEHRAGEVESSSPGADLLVALGRLLLLLTTLYRAGLRNKVRAQIDIAQKTYDVTWAEIAELFAQHQIPLTESQIRQATMIRNGTQGSQTQRRREIEELLNPEDLNRWADEGLTAAAIGRKVGINPDTVRRHLRKHGIDLRRGRRAN